MKKVIIIMMAVLLATLLVVSCKADVKAQEDRLSSVTVDSDVSRGFTTSIASNVDSIDQLVWYYKAVKTDGGLFVTGQQKNWTRLGGDTGVGLVGKSLGYLSYGTWNFSFKAVKNVDGCSSENNAVYEAYLPNVSIHEENTSLVVSLSQGAAVTTAKVVFTDLSFVVGSGIEIDATNGVFRLEVKEGENTILATTGNDTYSDGVTFDLTQLSTVSSLEKEYNAAGQHTYEFIVSYKPATANGDWTVVTTTEYSVYIPLGIAATISGSVDAIESVSDTVVSGVAHSYVIYGDGSWHCITCTGNAAGHLLEGTDAAYITVLDENRQPTTIIALTENATVGSGSITVSGNDVTYTNNGTNAVAQEVVIRTAGGTLTINAPLDTVKHYGEGEVLNLVAIAGSSYHEYGYFPKATIKQGRIVVEEEGIIPSVEITAVPTSEKPIKVETNKDLVVSASQAVVSALGIEPLDNVEIKVASSTAAVVVDEKIDSSDVLINGQPATSEQVVSITKVGTFSELQAALSAKKSYIMFTADIGYTTNGSGLLNVDYDATIDGNGYTLSGYGARGSNKTTLCINNNGGTQMVDVKLQNLTVSNPGAAGRPIETRGKISSLSLDNVKVNATGSGNPQGITIGGSQATAAMISINNSMIDAGRSGYPIISFNPFEAEINDSYFDGYCGIYFKNDTYGAENCNIVATNTTFNSPNSYSLEGDNSFGVFAIQQNVKNNKITLNSCSVNVEQTGTAYQSLVSFGYGNDHSGTVITVNGSDSYINGSLSTNGQCAPDSRIVLNGGTYTVNPLSSDAVEGMSIVKLGYGKTVRDTGDKTWIVE